MKTLHTPGPLFVGRFSEGDYNVTDADGGNVLASGIQKIEDAKLFTAAPDLLEALIELCAIAEDDDNYPTFTEKAMKAIKKATE